MIFLLCFSIRSDTSLIPIPNTSLVSLERSNSEETLCSQDDLSIHCHNSPKTPPTRRVRPYIINLLIN